MSKPCAVMPVPATDCGLGPCAATYPKFTGETVIVLATLGLPGADPVRPGAFQSRRAIRDDRRAPVEPVATEVDEAPALILVRGIGIEHALRGYPGGYRS